jgi:predicted O-methyltransferase YrrM
MQQNAVAVSSAQIAAWYDGKDLTTDWTSNNFPIWSGILSGLRSFPVRILEIGSWEGRSAIYFLNFLPRSTITCVDTFSGGDEHQANDLANLLPSIERRFDDNLAPFAGRVEKVKGDSRNELPVLALNRRRYDLVYIDGSHRAPDVYSDILFAWAMLNRRGLMILDDYKWTDLPAEIDRPKMAIDAFMWSFMGSYKLVHQDYQVILQRL